MFMPAVLTSKRYCAQRFAVSQYRHTADMSKSTRERSAFGLRLYEARLKAGLTQVQVKEALGISQGSLSDLEREGERSAYVPALAKLYGVDPYFLATGEASPPQIPLAHAVSYQPIDDPLLTREQILTMDVLPARFVYALEDDAMGAHGRAGTEVIFVRGYPPKPGAGVLIKDKFGALHVRRMAQGNRPGHWIGKAPNPQYRDMDSDEDGLELLAVWRGLNNWGLEDA
jgi:transcriptional regulator with XRE-family HTH domain